MWDIERLVPRALDYSVRLVEQQPVFVITCAVNALILVLMLYTVYNIKFKMRRLRNGRRFWRGKMSSEQLEHELVADAITDALERLYAENKITLRARNRWYSRLGKKHKLKDLFPRKRKKLSRFALIHLKDKAARGLEALKSMRPLPIPEPKKSKALLVSRKK